MKNQVGEGQLGELVRQTENKKVLTNILHCISCTSFLAYCFIRMRRLKFVKDFVTEMLLLYSSCHEIVQTNGSLCYSALMQCNAVLQMVLL